MTGIIYDRTGKGTRLPVLTEWEIIHGLGQPCDRFMVRFPYRKEMLETLKEACRFCGMNEGETVFYGVVDAYTVTCDVRGAVVELEGRSLGALLMDNEAESGEYFHLGLEDVLDRHVRSEGVEDIQTIDCPPLGHFTVRSGQSQWSVLQEYLQFSAGVAPRFDRSGTLLLDGGQGGAVRMIGGATPVSSVEFRDDRYGVITEVLVKKTRSGERSTVRNESMIARGGRTRRVLQVPRYLDHDGMRYTGEYQLARSREGSAVCILRLPKLFAGFAGDTLWLNDSAVGLTGKFRVSQSRCWAEKGQFGTELALAVWEAW